MFARARDYDFVKHELDFVTSTELIEIFCVV